MAIERLSPGTGPKPRGDYSMISVSQSGGRLAFLAGQTGRLPDGTISPDSRQQVADAFKNVETLLRSVNSGPSSIVHLRTFLVDRAVLGAFIDARAAVYGHWFGDVRPPSNTLLIVSGLADPEAIVEIEAIAATDDAGLSNHSTGPRMANRIQSVFGRRVASKSRGRGQRAIG